MIRYDNYVVYERYDSRLQKMYHSPISIHHNSTNMLSTYRIETKFGALDATNIQPCFMNPSLPLLLITRYVLSVFCHSSSLDKLTSYSSFHAPASVPLSELKNVVLGEGIATDVQPVEEYNRFTLG